ncbi:MAG: hypothetical protein IK065_04015, partial [Neisseriaceae bacterium]|nr:hypothetical protein [Neisseriaceae bacterium]
MATAEEIAKATGEDFSKTPKQPIGWKKDDNTLIDGETLLEAAENTPVVGGVVHAGEAGFAAGSGDFDKAAEHAAHAAVSAISGTGSKVGDEVLSQAADAAVSKVFEQQDDNQQSDSQNTDKPSWYETIENAYDKYTGEYDRREIEKLKQEYDYKNRLDYDLRQEAYRLENDNYNPEYDLLKQQAKRNEYQLSDAAKEEYQNALIELNKQHFDSTEAKENALAKLFGEYRDGKFEYNADDKQNSPNDKTNEHDKYDIEQNSETAATQETNNANKNILDKIQNILDELKDISAKIDEMDKSFDKGVLDKLLKLTNYFNNDFNWLKEKFDWLPDEFKDWFGLNRNGKFHIYDPLVLDLDGDGIELLKADGWNGVQFDYNGDGIKSSTGWVKADDGLLVWDRNGDGKINNGSEIFGEDMFPQKKLIVSDMGNTNSSSNSSSGSMSVSDVPSNPQPIVENDGFYALSKLDSNQDGIIDANDE